MVWLWQPISDPDHKLPVCASLRDLWYTGSY